MLAKGLHLCRSNDKPCVGGGAQSPHGNGLDSGQFSPSPASGDSEGAGGTKTILSWLRSKLPRS